MTIDNEKVVVHWFRRDLRLHDNTALNEALKSGSPVLPVFIFDANILAELPRDDARFSFIYDQLFSLEKVLSENGTSLHCFYGEPHSCWKEILKKFDVEAVYVNKDYEPYAIQRDMEIRSFLKKEGIATHFFKDQVIFEEDEILKDDGNPYTVFTPFKNKWLRNFENIDISPEKMTAFSSFLKGASSFPSLEDLGFVRSSIVVQPYSLKDLDSYAETRDIPYLNATSNLSPHLRFGTVSIRDIIHQLKDSNSTFLSELIWREFFMQILYHFPKVVKHNFKSKYDGIKWINSEADFEKWKAGKTGYPMVDAGMRQLNETGYMHNRVRMIVAGFLCKHLLIDWRWGEAYFAEKLLDYELSSNNGNWQWAAGTGCDAAPYFRIFNPIEQLKKFDKDHRYIKKWIPEFGTSSYPEPMVEHAFARKRALETYKLGIEN